MTLSSQPFYLPDDMKQSLGDIVIAWARVEGILAEFLSFLLNADSGAMYVLNQDVATGTQLKWIRILAANKFTHPMTTEGLKTLFDRIDCARTERNGYVHGIWNEGPEPGTACVQTVKLSRAEPVRTELVTRPDLDELFDEICSISDELFIVARKLGFL